jgi:hypothetical protein
MARSWALVALISSLLVAAASAGQRTNGLPDRDTFLTEVRKRLAGNEVLQSRYRYRERVTRLRFNPFGQMGTGPVDVFEVYPVADGLTYRRLVERNGEPVPANEVAEADRAFMQEYHDWKRNIAREGRDERAERLRKLAEKHAEDRARADEALRMFTFTLERRDVLEGQPVIVVSFKPKPDARPRSREAKIAASFAGVAYVHEHEYELMRVEAEAIRDTTFGYGVIARLHKGTKAVARRQKIGNAWLPVETRMTGTGRALLFRRVEINYLRQYFDYRPFEPAELTTLLASARSTSR